MSSSRTVSVELLRELPVFAGLSDAQLEAIVPLARVTDVPVQGQLLRQGEPARDLRIVVTGKFSLCLDLGGGKELCLLTMTRGEAIGWSALLDQATWTASATAIKPSSVLAINGAELRALCQSDHELGYFIMSNLFAAVAARLQDTRLQLLDMYSHE